MRVGLVGLMHESNTFLPGVTTLADFQLHGLLEGDALVERYRNAHHEVGGFLDGLAAAGIEVVPIYMTQAVPGGVITEAAAQALVSGLLAATRAAGSLDGMLIAAHGAAVSETQADFDGYWLSRLRAQVGDAMPLICTLDAHANVSQEMIAAVNASIVYRTNPHIDQYDRGREAARLMQRTLAGEVHPVQAAAFPDMVINIERQKTDEAPCRFVYEHADKLLGRPRVLSSSVVLGFPYADVREMGCAAIVVTDGDPEQARNLADDLAAQLWHRREAFVGLLVSVQDALDMVERDQGVTCLLDMGDNVGGGAPGDGTVLLHAIAERGLGPAFVCLFDSRAVSQAATAGRGAEVTMSMGGQTDQLHGLPYVESVKVVSLHDGHFTEDQVRHGGSPSYDMGDTAVVQTSDRVTIMLTSRRTPPFSLNQLTSCGLDPRAFRVLVAKGVHAPVAAYSPVCDRLIRVNTPGVTCADLSQFQFKHRRQPLFPFEDVSSGL